MFATDLLKCHRLSSIVLEESVGGWLARGRISIENTLFLKSESLCANIPAYVNFTSLLEWQI